MGKYLKKLFGKKEPEGAKTTSSDPAKDPNMIRVFDAYGRELFITKQQWRDDVLLENIKKAWNKPDDLYNMIFSALNDGFRSDVVDAAEQLYKIDADRSRGTCVWAIMLREEGRLDESERVIRDYLARHGEDGLIMTNLAKVYAQRKNQEKAEEILWRALELDPNQENGMMWYEAIHRESGGQEGSEKALRRVADLPQSWRAELWLARTAVASRQLDRALDYYHESLSRVSKPIPADMLMQISGDLGNAGHLTELLALVEPYFDPTSHGLQVGNNLIKAHVDLGQLEAARRILDQLYGLKRPDWRETLSFWDTELAKAGLDLSPRVEARSLRMSILTIQGPVWLPPDSPAAELFPARTCDGPLISVLGSSAETATNYHRIQPQLSDTPGRFSRALPLFLAEQLEFSTNARTQTLIPWLISESRGFVLSAAQWSNDDAVNYAGRSEQASDYVIILHVKAQQDPWVVELRLIQTIDAKVLNEFSVKFPSAKPELVLPDLTGRLLAPISSDVQRHSPPEHYSIPRQTQLSYYLLRLEQLLATRCTAMNGVPPGFLSGEREIIDGHIELCLASPHCIPARVLLAQTLLAMKRIHPDILAEFREKLALLQKENRLSEPSQSVLQRMIDNAVKN